MPGRTQNRQNAGSSQPTQEGRGVAMTRAEVQKQKAVTISRSLEGRRDQMLALLGGDEKLTDKFLTVALSAVVKSNDLLDADPLSILNAVRDAAQMGLEPAGPMGEGAIVAYREGQGNDAVKLAQFQPMVRGLRKLALQTPGVSVVNVGVRHEKDEFEYREGTDPFVRHVPWIEDDDPGAIMGVYAYARMNGETIALYMNNAEIARRKAVARTRKIWDAWPEEMAKKTVLRRLISEKLPMTTKMGLALNVDEADLGGAVTVPTSTPDRKAIAAPGSRTRARYIEADGIEGNAPQTPENGSGRPEGSEADSEATDEVEGSSRALCGAIGMKEGDVCVLDPHTEGPHEAANGAVWG